MDPVPETVAEAVKDVMLPPSTSPPRGWGTKLDTMRAAVGASASSWVVYAVSSGLVYALASVGDEYLPHATPGMVTVVWGLCHFGLIVVRQWKGGPN